MKPLLFPGNPQFWHETLRSMSHIAYGGADFGEVVSTSARIVEGDYDSWHEEWTATADRVAAEARRALDAGRGISARPGRVPARLELLPVGGVLPARPPVRPPPRPRLRPQRRLLPGRRRAPHPAHRTGPHLLRGHHPARLPLPGRRLRHAPPGPDHAQRVRRHRRGTPLQRRAGRSGARVHRPDLRRPRAARPPPPPGPGLPSGLGDRHHPLIDFVEKLPEVDDSRIALLGSSMGGVLAPRAAAFEHRLAALIAVDGVYDLGQVSTRNIPGDRDEAERLLRADSAPELDAGFEQIMSQDATARWAINHGMYVMGVDTAPRLRRLLPRLHPRRRHRRADPVPHPRLRRRRGRILHGPGTPVPPHTTRKPR